MNWFLNLIKSVAKSLGNDPLVQIVEGGLIDEGVSKGERFVERSIRIPEATAASICSHHGIDPVLFAKIQDDADLRFTSLVMLAGSGKLPADSPYNAWLPIQGVPDAPSV